MSNENTSIHEFDFNLISEYFSNIERQGPGSREVTIKALSFIEDLTAESLIADLGCETGGQTMLIAQRAPGTIIGIDLSPTFIDLFNVPQVKAQEIILRKYAGNEMAESLVANERSEAQLYNNYKNY